MAKPAFIYAFDNFGPYRFVELCGQLLGSRYSGFLLGGVGPDGGIDGEIDQVLGELRPSSLTTLPVIDQILRPGGLIIFQFKHEVTARIGQAHSREALLRHYQCTARKKCELHRELVRAKAPGTYVLVTNVEVNSQFRAKFIDTCRTHNPDIANYQIVGLDELEQWVTSEPLLRHLYFPTIFEAPRYNLRLETKLVTAVPVYGDQPADADFRQAIEYLCVSVLNIGTVASYVDAIRFLAVVDGNVQYIVTLQDFDPILSQMNPKKGAAIEPGRKQDFYFPPLEILAAKAFPDKEAVIMEAIASDEIGNTYSASIPERVRAE